MNYKRRRFTELLIYQVVEFYQQFLLHIRILYDLTVLHQRLNCNSLNCTTTNNNVIYFNNKRN